MVVKNIKKGIVPEELHFEILSPKQNALLKKLIKKKLQKRETEKELKRVKERTMDAGLDEKRKKKLERKKEKLEQLYEERRYLYFDNSERQILHQIRDKIKSLENKFPEVKEIKTIFDAIGEEI